MRRLACRMPRCPRSWLPALALVALAASAPWARAVPRGAAPVRILVNGDAPAQPFPHFWEQMFGSGRAILSLRADYRRDLRQVKRATELRLIRFHGIFDRGVGIVHLDARGRPVYNFTNVDAIYDGLLKNGVRPYVELSFMPPALAAHQVSNGFWYHPIVSPPKSWALWRQLIQHFARHLIHRYGIQQVSHWYFEVWNEPNLSFWAGTPKQATYFHLYDVTARALKSVSPRLRVGGPATAQTAWIGTFIRHCVRRHVPVDFVSTHVYGDDTAENVFGRHEHISRRDMVIRAVKKVHRQVADSPLPHLPIIFSEFNATYTGDEIDVTDSPYIGPWLANTIRATAGLVHLMSYWTFSDVFEEQGVVSTPFHGGFGLIAVGDIPKASFNDFKLLHWLGDVRLANRSHSAIVTRRPDGMLSIALWNYAPPGPGGHTRTDLLQLRHLDGARYAYIWVVDRNHGSALTAWRAMGRPAYPTVEQLRVLREAARLPPPRIVALHGASAQLSLRLIPHALALVRLER